MNDNNVTSTRRTVLKASAAAAAAVTGVSTLTGTTAAASSGVYSPYVGTWTDGVSKAINRDIDHVVFGPAGDGTDDGQVNPGWLAQCSSGSCGEESLDKYLSDIQTLQDNGISVGLMVGGWKGRVIARDADSVSELKAGYETALDTLGISHIDIDDENADDTGRSENLNTMRAQALAQLQDERPELTVGYTVAANTQGMNSNPGAHSPGEHWMEEIAQTDLELDYVQLMVMHLGSDPTKQTFESAVDSTASFLSGVYPNRSMDDIYGMIGVVPRYVELTQSSAQGLLELAQNKGLYSIAPWRLGEEDGQFTEIFSEFSSGGTGPGTPSADLSVSPSEPSPGEQVTFDASGSSSPNGSIVEYQWDFGNGTTLTTQSATTTQRFDSGTYSSSVTIVDETEMTASASVSLSVSDDSDGGSSYPTWDATATYTGGDRVSYNGTAWEAQWWTQGDEPGSSQWGPWDEVSDSGGGSGNDGPTASVSVSSTNVTVGDSVSVDASGSSDSDGSIASYGWDFGDGTTATGQTASHSYSSSGDYTITVTVADDDGATDSASTTVTVQSDGGGGSCDAPAWDSGATYTGGDRASYDGAVWEAQWWTRGDEPGSSQWGPWDKVEDC